MDEVEEARGMFIVLSTTLDSVRSKYLQYLSHSFSFKPHSSHKKFLLTTCLTEFLKGGYFRSFSISKSSSG